MYEVEVEPVVVVQVELSGEVCQVKVMLPIVEYPVRVKLKAVDGQAVPTLELSEPAVGVPVQAGNATIFTS